MFPHIQAHCDALVASFAAIPDERKALLAGIALSGALMTTQFAALSEADRAAVLGGNLERLLSAGAA